MSKTYQLAPIIVNGNNCDPSCPHFSREPSIDEEQAGWDGCCDFDNMMYLEYDGEDYIRCNACISVIGDETAERKEEVDKLVASFNSRNQ